MAATTRPVCPRCTHYHVTWDPDHPHGCRGYGFKTKESPAAVVRRLSGADCQLYSKKEKK